MIDQKARSRIMLGSSTVPARPAGSSEPGCEQAAPYAIDRHRHRKRTSLMAQRGPLAGITIIDLSRILAGPYCTLLLAELGARVIKVEPPQQGDDARQYGPFKNGRSTYFASVNRGKESIPLALQSPSRPEIFDPLLD